MRTVHSLISKFWSCIQLNNMSKFSYLEMKGSNCEFKCFNIVTLILFSLSVVAVTKNLCKSLLMIRLIFELICNWLVEGKCKVQHVYIANFLIYGFSSSKKSSTDLSIKYTMHIAYSLKSKIDKVFKAKITMAVLSFDRSCWAWLPSIWALDDYSISSHKKLWLFLARISV